MAQIDGKFLVHGYEAADRVVNFLRKSNCAFGCSNFFDVASATAGPASVITKIASAAIWQVFLRFEFSFVLSTRSHRKSGYHTICG